MNLVKLVWVVAIHSIIHGALGAFFVASSDYVNKKPELIYSFLGLNVVLIFLGAGVFCTILWRQPFCARFFGALLIIMALVYLAVGILYFLKYLQFLANSLPDKLLFHTDFMCWVGPESIMTVWHVIIVLLVGFILLWFVYGILLCKYAPLACCLPCTPPCKPKIPKPKKCLPICPLAPPPPCSPPCPPPTPPPPPPTCKAPCSAKTCPQKSCPAPSTPTCPPPTPTCPPPTPTCPPPAPACPAATPPCPPPAPACGSPPPCSPCPSAKKPPKFVLEVNKGFSN